VVLGDGSKHGEIPRLDDDDLNRFAVDFGFRITVAQMTSDHFLVREHLRPLLDDTDASIFRTAHAYRNRTYHADHHNEALLPLIASEYALAVGRAFERIQLRNVGSSMSNSEAEQLAVFGYVPDKSEFGRGMFRPAEAAEQVVNSITADLEQTLHEVRVQLIADLVDRLEWCDDMIDTLLTGGMDVTRFAHAFRWSQFWDAIKTDPQIVDFDREIARLQDASLQDGRIRERLDQEYAVNDKRNERISELSGEVEIEFDSGSIVRLLKRVRKLQAAETRANLFSRYREIDEIVERLESLLERIAVGWDEWVESEGTRMREEASLRETVDPGRDESSNP
ncbi:MAG: hypothetical protein ACRDKE_07545, partial [Solirubrobacterales bacterium]